SIGAAYETAARYLDVTIATMLGVRQAGPVGAVAVEGSGGGLRRGEGGGGWRAGRREPVAVEASEAALRLDETVREYLAENGSARRDLDALARLVGGAARGRRSGGVKDDAPGGAA